MTDKQIEAFQRSADRQGITLEEAMNQSTKPIKKVKLRGAGDVVKKITDALGIEQCGGCQQRQIDYNQKLPMKPVMDLLDKIGINNETDEDPS